MVRGELGFHAVGKDRTLSYQKAEKMDAVLEGRLLEARLLLRALGERGRVSALPTKGTGQM